MELFTNIRTLAVSHLRRSVKTSWTFNWNIWIYILAYYIPWDRGINRSTNTRSRRLKWVVKFKIVDKIVYFWAQRSKNILLKFVWIYIHSVFTCFIFEPERWFRPWSKLTVTAWILVLPFKTTLNPCFHSRAWLQLPHISDPPGTFKVLLMSL